MWYHLLTRMDRGAKNTVWYVTAKKLVHIVGTNNPPPPPHPASIPVSTERDRLKKKCARRNPQYIPYDTLIRKTYSMFLFNV